MQDILVQIIFGWPAVITSLLVSVAGLWFKKPILLVVGGILIILFTIYISGYWRPAGILPLFQLGAAYALWKKKTAACLGAAFAPGHHERQSGICGFDPAALNH
jgi:hypothetical protein